MCDTCSWRREPKTTLPGCTDSAAAAAAADYDTTVSSATQMISTSRVFGLHVCRFGCKGKNQVKLRTNVTFSTELDLAPFLSSSALNTSCSSSYHLYAVVVSSSHFHTWQKNHPVPSLARRRGKKKPKTCRRSLSRPLLSPEPRRESKHGPLHGAVPQHRHPDMALLWRLSGQGGQGRPGADRQCLHAALQSQAPEQAKDPRTVITTHSILHLLTFIIYNFI